MTFSYSVAIRTLGTAGEKYFRTLKSISDQTVQPTAIYVYIPYGYELPKHTIGVEKYIRCEKGMVAQRSLSFSEIEDEWILFLDDDIFLPNDYIQRAVDFLSRHDKADLITSSFYHEYDKSLLHKIKLLFLFVFPTKSKKWAYRINHAGRFFYNISPESFMLTQTGPGACMLCRKSVYSQSRFYEERWMDQLGYALGDDQLFHYKMYLRGATEYIWRDSGAIHLDAGNANRKFDGEAVRKMNLALFLVWHRSVYRLKNNNFFNKVFAILAYVCSFILKLIYSPLFMFKGIPNAPLKTIQGLYDGIKYVRQESYILLPYFDEK